MNTAILVTILAVSSLGACANTPRADTDVGLNTIEMIENHGYPAESHYITTEDGYILTYHRIPHGIDDDGSVKRPPVLIMHGLMSSSADFVNMGTDRSLSYYLSDNGYDVWLGNARGNTWSRNHTTLDVTTNPGAFLNFSWHEIGHYDLPAAVDYILETTEAEGLYYVGHSQGCTSFLVFGSTRPEYNPKIKLASLMGPASLMDNEPNVLAKGAAKYIYEIEKLVVKYNFNEFPTFPPELHTALGNFCLENSRLCELFLTLIDGKDLAQFDASKFPVMLTNLPAGAAAKQVLHYGQSVKNGGFRQYDYGAEKNLEIYGNASPPAYNISLITAPVALYYGKNDGLVSYLDAQNLARMLPNLANDYLVPYELFNHLDPMVAIDIIELVYKEILTVMQNY